MSVVVNARAVEDGWPALVYGNATHTRRIRHAGGRVSHYVDALGPRGRNRGAAVVVMAHVLAVLGPNTRGGGLVSPAPAPAGAASPARSA